MNNYTIEFQPLGRKISCGGDETVLSAARRLGIGINNVCGGHGTCGSCRIRILSGRLSKPTDNEISHEPGEEYRLACQAYPQSDCIVSMPLDSLTTVQRLQLEGQDTAVTIEPVIDNYILQLSIPSLKDQRADVERLKDELLIKYKRTCSRVDLPVLKVLPTQIRNNDWKCKVVLKDDEIIAVMDTAMKPLGLAVDIGTTKIAGYLIDLSDGNTITSKGVLNPQVTYGEDVISRISSTIGSDEQKDEIRKITVAAINKLVLEMCQESDRKIEQIVEGVVVANTAMHHLFLGLPAKQLAVYPYVPVVSDSLNIKARDIGLDINQGAYVHLLPNIAGFVGADHVSALLATGTWKNNGPSIMMDIGTNTEIALINEGRITSVSAASGPAFEGAHIKHGMRAAGGAIEKILIEGNEVKYQTVDNVAPIGLCGSGILDIAAQMYLNGIVDDSGKLKPEHPRVRKDRDNLELVLVNEGESEAQSDIVFTQSDIREFQLAKAAIRAAIQVLLESEKLTESQIKDITIAGAFGTYIDVNSAIITGMLPSLPLPIFHQVGNAAGMGAKMALISKAKRAEAVEIAARIHYLELAASHDFMRIFSQASYFGVYRIVDGKRRK